jgi:hypothetical protein
LARFCQNSAHENDNSTIKKFDEPLVFAGLNHGRVLLTAGVVQSIGASVLCEFYAPATNRWSPTGSLNQARYNHRSVLLPDGRALAISGEDASTNALTSAELYDPASGTWSFTGSLSIGRAQAFDAILLLTARFLSREVITPLPAER